MDSSIAARMTSVFIGDRQLIHPGSCGHAVVGVADAPVAASFCPMRAFRSLLLAACVGATLSAQQTKVIPAGMDYVEGPTVFSYPFGRQDAAIQLLVDADRLTLGQGVITGIRFRGSQQTQSTAGYTKPYVVTAYTVSTSAAAMQTDPLANIGSATGTVVFQGPLTLPPVGPLTLAPGPFAIQIPFSIPYVFDGSQGNLLLLIETTDQAPVPGLYRIDAVQFRNNVVEGLVAAVDAQGCVVGGQFLTSATSAASAIVGGQVATTLTATPAGAFPVVLALLSFARADQDLSLFGMPSGCTGRVGAFAFQLLLANPSLPAAAWSVPASPIFIGAAVVTQSLGLPPNNSLAGAVASNAEAIRIGPATLPTIHEMAAFRSTTGWFMGQAGEFVPVVQFEGVFP
jgi:hypothetical protein